MYAVALKFFAVVTIARRRSSSRTARSRSRARRRPRRRGCTRACSAATSRSASFGALLVGMFAPEVARDPRAAELSRALRRPAVWLAFAAVALGAYTVASLGIGLALRTPLLGWCACGGGAVAAGAQRRADAALRRSGAGDAHVSGLLGGAMLTYRVAQHVLSAAVSRRAHGSRCSCSRSVLGLDRCSASRRTGAADWR